MQSYCEGADDRVHKVSLRQAGWLIDEMKVNFKFLKIIIGRIFILFAVFNKVTALLEQ